MHHGYLPAQNQANWIGVGGVTEIEAKPFYKPFLFPQKPVDLVSKCGD
jgi:hypothetical protein